MEPDPTAVAFVLAEPTERTVELIGLLDTGALDPTSSRARVAHQVTLGGASLDRTMSLLRAWRGDYDCDENGGVVGSGLTLVTTGHRVPLR